MSVLAFIIWLVCWMFTTLFVIATVRSLAADDRFVITAAVLSVTALFILGMLNVSG